MTILYRPKSKKLKANFTKEIKAEPHLIASFLTHLK